MNNSKVRDCSAWTHHAFLDEELGSFQGPCHVLAKSLSLLLIQDLSVEGANLQKTHRFILQWKKELIRNRF